MNVLELKNLLNSANIKKVNVNIDYFNSVLGEIKIVFNPDRDNFLILSGKFLIIIEPYGFKKCIEIRTITGTKFQ